VASVDDFHDAFLSGRHKHRLIRHDDYVTAPKPSGYRSVHLRLRLPTVSSDRSSTYNGLNIEVQIRSRLQHAWATAVVTVCTFTQQALKSSQGEGEWLRFFQLMSSEVAHVEAVAVFTHEYGRRSQTVHVSCPRRLVPKLPDRLPHGR
jgi:putative GTP pyrophosphokinase